jgi:hypothetical protein
MSARAAVLAAHVRALGDHDLNDLLVELSCARFAALVEVALARPVQPAGLVFRFEPTPAADPNDPPGWTVVACGPRRELGTVTREPQPSPTRKRPLVVWRAFTRHGQPVSDGTGWVWPRRVDAAAALAWVSPASGARAMALAAYVRALGDDDLGELLVELPCARFDALLETAFPQAVEAGAAA